MAQLAPAPADGLTNIEAEVALLGAVLIENGVLDTIPALGAEAFSAPLHGRLWDAIAAQRVNGQVSAVTLRPLFENDPDLPALGGITYLARLSADGQGLLAAPELAAQLAELAQRRALRDRITAAWGAINDLTAPLDLAIEAFAAPDTLAQSSASTFAFITVDELRRLPPPDWLIHDLVVSDGLSIIYGPPGSGKSFVALDMAMRVALGWDWHGVKTKRAGVLYIAGEGVRGLGKRADGWALKHKIYAENIPFAAITVAPQLLDPAEVTKLVRTIDEIKRTLDFTADLIIIDTVSRSIAGQDENGQETMSAFIRACDKVKQHTGGAIIGVHHSGKDIERGMRGSTVLLGGCDAAIRCEKNGQTVTLTTEKQKDAEEMAPVFLELEPYRWNTGSPDQPGEDHSTLVPAIGEAPKGSTLSRDWIARAFGMMADAWGAGRPMSPKSQTRSEGRFAPSIFASQIGGDATEWAALITSWLEQGAVSYECYDKHAKKYGLQVLDAIL